MHLEGYQLTVPAKAPKPLRTWTRHDDVTLAACGTCLTGFWGNWGWDVFPLTDEADTKAGSCARDTRVVKSSHGMRASEIGGIYCNCGRGLTHVSAAQGRAAKLVEHRAVSR